MGYAIVESVVNALKEAGIRADKAYPGKIMPAPEGIVAAVSLKLCDRAKKLECVQVSVLGPARLGGAECEKAGAAVCDVLQGLGANCIQNACQFHSNTGLFSVEVQGSFLTEQPSEPDDEPVVYSFSATVAGKNVDNLVSATAHRVWNEESRTLSETWTVRLVEQITGTEDTEAVGEPFEIRLTRNGQTDIFTGCSWSSWQRVLDSNGLQQTRSAVAQSRSTATV